MKAVLKNTLIENYRMPLKQVLALPEILHKTLLYCRINYQDDAYYFKLNITRNNNIHESEDDYYLNNLNWMMGNLEALRNEGLELFNDAMQEIQI